ncbi:hypothetical protein FWH30_00930 [Microgenomates group bacterium]|nr:hypothetical protein [Microgenomates group bacterium]
MTETATPPEDFETADLPEDTDPRHARRILLFQALFANSFTPQNWDKQDFNFDQKTINKVQDIQQYLPEFDEQIIAVAPERPIQEITKADLFVLYTILYENKTKNTPTKVLINEGIELAKEFGNDNSFAFINAVLEKLLITTNQA